MTPLAESEILRAGAIAIVVMMVLLVVRGVILNRAAHWARRTNTEFDNLVLDSCRWPSLLWCVAIGLYLGVDLVELPARYARYLTTLFYVIVIISVTFTLANLSGRIFRHYLQKSDLPLPTTGLAYGVMKGSILTIGFLVMLTTLGVSVAPLLTALGVGGLAVALALQDTLQNLFAGLHILVEKSLRVGDVIRLESGQEGYVEDITWRTTRVRMVPNNMVVIPNSKLAQSVVINYSLPEKRMAVLIPVSVSYSADPERIERVLLEEAHAAIGELPGLLAEPEPLVRFSPGFGESSLDFTLICQVGEYVDQYPVQHELRKRIFRRFQQEGIEIPFPQRTVHLHQAPA